MSYDDKITAHQARLDKARAMGSAKRLAERAATDHILNARERVAVLCDEDSFAETGVFAQSTNPDHAGRTPGDGMVSGFGRVDGRLIGVNAADFTTLGSSSAEIMGKKQGRVARIARENGHPLVYLMECAGGRIPDIMGASGIGLSGERAQYHRPRIVPTASAVLGLTYGGGAFSSILSDFTVMRKDAIWAVSSPNVTSVAISEDEAADALGGWRLHTEVTGYADAVVDTDKQAIDTIKQFLSYMPDHNGVAPDRIAVPDGAEDAIQSVLDLVPEARGQVYDVRQVIEAIVDPGSFFPIKQRYAKVAVTGLARIDGRAVGIAASNPRFKGGALDPDACSKIANLIMLCDCYNLPIIFLADTPGFLVGTESEKKRLGGKIMTFMQALELSTVPKIALVLRKSFGQAYLNLGGGKADETASWFTGEISFMDPAVAVNVAFGVRAEDDPDRFAQLVDQVSKQTSAYDLAAPYLAHAVIDPRESRDYLKSTLAIHDRGRTQGVGDHLMVNWPATL